MTAMHHPLDLSPEHAIGRKTPSEWSAIARAHVASLDHSTFTAAQDLALCEGLWAGYSHEVVAAKLVIPPISNGYGLQTLLMFAELRGGGANKIDPGFEALTKEVVPNVLAWEPSPGKMTELFQNGDGVIGVWGSGRVKALSDTGFPVKFVYPKEGAFALFTAVCPIAKKQPKPGAQKFVQYLFSPEVQAILADGQAWGPMNSKVKLPPNLAKDVPYGPEQIAKLKPVDYKIVNVKRAEWTNRWNRTVER